MIIYILKILDFIKILNCLFVRDLLTKATILPFQNYFNISENLYQHNTRYAKQNSVIQGWYNIFFKNFPDFSWK